MDQFQVEAIAHAGDDDGPEDGDKKGSEDNGNLVEKHKEDDEERDHKQLMLHHCFPCSMPVSETGGPGCIPTQLAAGRLGLYRRLDFGKRR